MESNKKLDKESKIERVMKYCIVDTDKFVKAGGDVFGHYQSDGQVIVNEIEVLRDREKKISLEEAVEALDGKVYDNTEIKLIISKGKFKLKY
jgi:hypothetical protein